jgi:DNA repair exonuclease SbcCD nuclease subunit
MRFSFFHAADLHLGAASEGVMRNAPQTVREAVDSSTYRAFEKLISDAERDRPAFVLFPGDLYNSSDGNLKARLAFRDGVRRLEAHGISSVVIRGNHDPLVGEDSLVLPESCQVLPVKPPEPITLQLGDVPIAKVYGESYPGIRVPKNLATKYPRVFPGEDGLLQIAMLHGNVLGERSLGSGEKNPSDYAPFSLEDLGNGGYDYWALGHVHTHRVLCQAPGWAVYTGSLQGVSPRERGPHGYVAVTASNARVESVEFRPADVLRWAEAEVDVTGATTLNEIEVRTNLQVRALLEEAEGRPVVARLHLVGATTLDAELRQEDFGDHMKRMQAIFASERPFLWIEDWRIDTKPELDWAAIRSSHSVQGYLLGLAEGRYPEFQADLASRLKKESGRLKWELPEDVDLNALLRSAAEHAVGLLNSGVDA